MKVSYEWLTEYVPTMPPPKEVVSGLTMHSFEIEGMEQFEGDTILDVKILPNRAHDCLSHYGIASEAAAVFNLEKTDLLPPVSVPKADTFSLDIDTPLCTRGLMVHISGIRVTESPEWMQKRLKAVGARPINSIVDITNYLTFAFGQPMHAFDTAKLSADRKGRYELKIRTAKKEEKIRLLTDAEYVLSPSMIVIADKEKALDVAGVMGGKDTGVSDTTTDIILSLSGFDAVTIRKTAAELKIRTDASQRFENDLSPTLADRVLPYALKLIADISGGSARGMIDIYPKRPTPVIIAVEPSFITNRLGTDLPTETIMSLLVRERIAVEEKNGKLFVAPPAERLDLCIPEDIVEEVGRLHGYEHIAPRNLESKNSVHIGTDYIFHAIRNILKQAGFSEIYTYSFVSRGALEVANPMASDKKFLRKNLADAMSASLEYNFKYLDLLGMKEVKLFEIGTVFGTTESIHLALGALFPKSSKTNHDETVAAGIAAVEQALGVSFGDVSIVGGIAEIDLGKFMEEIAIPETYPSSLWEMVTPTVFWKPISPYPFAVRDIAVFVPETTSPEKVEDLIRTRLSPLVVRFSLFDTFTKTFPDGTKKTSYAFRLVFQSPKKTLVDEDMNSVMNPIYEALKAEEGFEIR